MSSPYERLIITIVILISIFIIIYAEYVAHDCIPHKKCNHSVPKPTEEDDVNETIDKISDMVQNNCDFIAWRQALLAGLIVVIPVTYYFRNRFPDLLDAIVIVAIVFITTFYSWSWILAHFFYPNTDSIRESLSKLKDKINEQESAGISGQVIGHQLSSID